MNFDEHDDLWRLLGRAPAPKASPFFARNVLRAIRGGRRETPSFGSWLARWRSAGAAFAAAALVALSVVSGKLGPGSASESGRMTGQMTADPIDEAAAELAASPEFVVIENLDTLLAWEANEAWLDDSSAPY